MDRKVWLTLLAVMGVVLVAIGFRFYDIQHYPPGLFPDQAANGEDALLILDGDWRPFYPRGNGREALFFYVQAALIKLFGSGVWPLFAASALVGVATVLATFFATRVYFGRLAGVLAALFLATNHWHVTLSRTGFRAILIPLFVALFTALVGYTIQARAQGQHTRSGLYAALAGASFAAGFYTYIAYRIMVAVLLGMLLVMLLAALHPQIGFPHLRRYRWPLLVAAVAAVVVVTPLALYFWQHPQDFVGRAGQVSIFSRDLQQQYGGGKLLATLGYAFRETAVSFLAGQGDSNWRHAVPGYPLLNPLVGVLFLLGLAWFAAGLGRLVSTMRRGQELHRSLIYPYVLLLLLGMLVPVITTAEGLPHGLRSVGLVVPIFMLAGTAGSVCLYWIKRQLPRPRRAAAFGVALGLLLVGSAYDGTLYFVIARNDAQAYAAYRGDLTRVAVFVRDHPSLLPASRPLLVLDAFSLQTMHYLTSVAPHEHVVGGEPHPDEAAHRYVAVEPRAAEATQLTPGQLIIFTQSTMSEAHRFARTHPHLEIFAQEFNRWGGEILRVYQGRDESTVDSLDA